MFSNIVRRGKLKLMTLKENYTYTREAHKLTAIYFFLILTFIIIIFFFNGTTVNVDEDMVFQR